MHRRILSIPDLPLPFFQRRWFKEDGTVVGFTM